MVAAAILKNPKTDKSWQQFDATKFGMVTQFDTNDASHS